MFMVIMNCIYLYKNNLRRELAGKCHRALFLTYLFIISQKSDGSMALCLPGDFILLSAPQANLISCLCDSPNTFWHHGTPSSE